MLNDFLPSDLIRGDLRSNIPAFLDDFSNLEFDDGDLELLMDSLNEKGDSEDEND